MHDQFACGQRVVPHEPAVDRLAGARDACDARPRALAAHAPPPAVAQRHVDPVEQRHGHQVFGVGRREGVEPHGVEDVPGGHLAGVVHARQRQSVGPHAVEAVETVVEDLLGVGLAADETIVVGRAVVGLVAVAVLADEAREVVDLVARPGPGEERVEQRPEGLGTLVEADQPLRVVRREEGSLPGVRLAVHVFVVGVLRAEGGEPLAVREPAAHGR